VRFAWMRIECYGMRIHRKRLPVPKVQAISRKIDHSA
jgi:hypothetical protein